MPSIVKVPKGNWDFLGFSFNGKHCVEDLGIMRTSEGSRYKENLTPQIQEITSQHPGMDGAFLTGVQHRQRVFDIPFAFDGLTQQQVWNIQETFLGDGIHDLWFDEYPYKVWDAKVTGQPQLQVIPFDDGNGGILYKGEGTVQFTAYYPYAHTPDYVLKKDGSQADGRIYSSYSDFKNREQWKEAANLLDNLTNSYYSEVEMPLFLTILPIYDYDYDYNNDIGVCKGLIGGLKEKMESITIQHNKPYIIEESSFKNDKKLKTVNIINATEIRQYAFLGCSNLEEITIPSTITFLDYGILPKRYYEVQSSPPKYKVNMDGYWKIVSGGGVSDMYYNATELRDKYPDLGTQNAYILAQNSSRRFYRISQQEAMGINEITN